VVPVGEPIAYIATTADDLLEGLLDQPDTPSGPQQPASPETELPPSTAALPAAGTAKRAVPLARRRARELGVDLNSVEGTGPGGTVRLADVARAAAHTQTPAAAPAARSDASAARKRRSARAAVARKMTASAAVPQFTVYRRLDLETLAASRGRRGWTPLLTKAFAHVLRDEPMLNAQWIEDACRPLESVAVALAVDTDRGLLAPVLSDPDLATADELDERIRDLVQRARSGKLTVQEMSATASTTVSNLGGMGVDAFNALLTPPQATALSLGSVGSHAVPVGRGIGLRMACTVGLTVDHRVADGADAARALDALQTLVNDPARFVEAGTLLSGRA
jgi:pyruvate dehydrogenase E2 component (dihydrolipoamide acetyltransferase)